jgi:hypothetical protein
MSSHALVLAKIENAHDRGQWIETSDACGNGNKWAMG